MPGTAKRKVLRACYAMPGTDRAYGATRLGFACQDWLAAQRSARRELAAKMRHDSLILRRGSLILRRGSAILRRGSAIPCRGETRQPYPVRQPGLVSVQVVAARDAAHVTKLTWALFMLPCATSVTSPHGCNGSVSDAAPLSFSHTH
eukprot:2694178-Rhodomonas_salina.2